MTRDEHLAWCKKRALEYLDRGDLQNAIASMGSDLDKHEDFRGILKNLFPLAVIYVANSDSEGVSRWIEGFR